MSQSKPNIPIGEQLRQQRVEVLGKGLREMARLLGVTPAHLTDVEKGRRSPSEELLCKIAKEYGLEQAVLRSGWHKADTVVEEVATQDETTAEKVPQFLRTARNLSPAQWDQLIRQADRLSNAKKSGGGRSGE
ncbi:MAG: helix-turn-helix transcriptional regulator [Pseudomonadota bacterium]